LRTRAIPELYVHDKALNKSTFTFTEFTLYFTYFTENSILGNIKLAAIRGREIDYHIPIIRDRHET